MTADDAPEVADAPTGAVGADADATGHRSGGSGSAVAGPRKKHRHDLGHEDHGPVYAAGTTRAIQGLLGLWIALTVVLVVYTLVVTAR